MLWGLGEHQIEGGGALVREGYLGGEANSNMYWALFFSLIRQYCFSVFCYPL